MRIVWFALAAALMGSACGTSTPPPTGAAAPPAPPTVDVVAVVEKPVDLTLDMPGELNSYQTVAVYSKVTGFVKSITVDRGARVRAGQLLVQLDAPELLAQRAEAQSKVQAASAQLEAARSKAESSASTYDKLKAASATAGVVAGNDLTIAQKAVEADRNQVAAAQQLVEAARQALGSITQMEDYLRVTAPFDGVVTERNVHPGALVGPGSASSASTPLVRVVDNSRLRLVVPVPEAYLSGASVGVPLTFSVAAYPGQSFSGKVARLANTVDVKTRTMAVEIDVPNAGGELSPGSFCQVRWPVHRPTPSLFVPSRSVANTTGRTFVIRVRDNKTEWVDVKVGLTVGALVEVFGPLKPGDLVAARGTDELRPGVEVRVQSGK